MFDKNFNDKVRKMFEKMADYKGRLFELPNSKKKYLNHIKYVYQTLSKKAKDEAMEKFKDKD